MMKKTTILVVEDEAITAKDLQMQLKHMGYDVPFIAASGEDAIEKALEIKPDLLLMDIMLQGNIDGIEAARQIHRTLNIPVIYLSAYTDTMLSERAKDTEPFGYLSKPFKGYDLQNTIEMALYKHRVEKKLREEKKFTENAINAQIDTFFVFDPSTGKAIRWNTKFREISGYSNDEIAGLKAPDAYYGPEDIKKAATVIDDVREYGQGRTEISLICKDGRKLLTEYIASAIKDEQENIKYIIAIGRDISQRKEAEEKVKAAESRLRSLIEQTTDAVFCYEFTSPIPVSLSIDKQVKLMYDCTLADCNLVCAKSYGADSTEQVIGRRLTELFGTLPGSLDRLFRNLIRGGYRVEDGEAVEKFPDGTERYYLNNGYGVVENGVLLRVWGTFRDVTERKRAEKDLQESERRYHSLIENLPSVVWVSDADGATKFISPNIIKVYGYTPEEIYTSDDNLWFGRIHPEEKEKVKTAYSDMFLRETTFDITYRIKRKDGEWIWLHDRAVTTYEKDGKQYAYGVFSDVTKHKLTEEALQASEEKFSRAFHSAATIITISTINEGRFIDVNEAFLTAFGYERGEVVGKTSTELNIFESPGQRDTIKEMILKTGSVHDFEIKVLTKSGDARWGSVSFSTIQLKGETCFLSVMNDITERKKAETDILKFRFISDNASDALFLVDRDSKFQYVNKAACRLLGYSEDELLTLGVPDIDILYDLVKFQQVFDLIQKEAAPTVETVNKRKDGSTFPAEITSTGLQIDGKTYIFSAMRDVSARKETENRLRNSNAFLSSLIQSPSDIIILSVDRDYNYTFFNTAHINEMKKVWGADIETGSNMLEYIPLEDERKKVRVNLERAMNGEHFVEEEGYGNLENRFWYRLAYSPICGEDNNVSGVTVFISDITERKEAEKALWDKEERFRTIVEQSPFSIQILDADGLTLKVNRAWEHLWGLTVQDLKDYNMLHDSQLEQKGILTYLQRAYKGETVFIPAIEYDAVKTIGKGTTRWVKGYAYPVKDLEKNVRIVVVMHEDVTKQKNAEAALEKAKIEIEQWNRTLEKRVKEKSEELERSQAQLIQSEKLSAMGQMAGGLAHELNSPLAGLLPMLEKFKDGAEKDSVAYNELSMMHKACEYMAKIVKDFSSFSRESTGRLQDLNVVEIIDDTLNFHASRIKQNSIHIIKEFERELPVVKGEKNKIQQVVLNIISNALDATHKMGTLTIKASHNKLGNSFVMQFIDDGIGIDKESFGKIFDPFYTTKRPGKGTGLGLSISHKIIEKHGGKISVESEPGKGSTFTIILPAD